MQTFVFPKDGGGHVLLTFSDFVDTKCHQQIKLFTYPITFLTSTTKINTNFATEISVPQRMNPHGFSSSTTVDLTLLFQSEISQHMLDGLP